MSPTRPTFPQHARTIAEASPSITPSPSPPPTGARRRDREDRTSFSSIKESDCGVAQSFVESKETSHNNTWAQHNPQYVAGPTNMATLAVTGPTFCCPCGRFRGWKQLKLRGKGLSRSSSDLRLLGSDARQGWEWETSPERVAEVKTKNPMPRVSGPGEAPIERLPSEVLDQIIALLVVDLPPNGYTPRNVDLIACLLASRTLHAATLTTLYNRITLPHSLIFSKFLNRLKHYPALGTLVRRLDFSHFSSVGLGRTRRMNAEIQMLTSATMLECLNLTPRLQEFLVQEHLDDDMDALVLQKIFCDLPLLQAVDFCASSSSAFRSAFTEVVNSSNLAFPASLGIRRLSLHECTTLPASTFVDLLPRLPHLTHLEVGHTQITDAALHAIPVTARLTHLSLSRCTHVSGESVVDFVANHPAAKDTLVYLNLQADITRYRLLTLSDVDKLLPALPTSLRALNISGAKILAQHVPLLLPLTKHLEELSLGHAELSMDDINGLFVPKSPVDDNGDLSMEEQSWTGPTLHYLDLTGIASVTAGKLFSNSCVLLRPMTQPLEVLEIGDKVLSGLREKVTTSRRLGWVVRDLGRRGWYVREPAKDLPPSQRDSGRRAWKMGAMWWGMRKVPVAWGEVGGLYGHYMFKK
ncbi:MAG: hypothetical protein M1817_003078 [Caeruleum heppii]|nr:MAG: hypothetical protein M1817_003078 [Caeruleum heppii]